MFERMWVIGEVVFFIWVVIQSIFGVIFVKLLVGVLGGLIGLGFYRGDGCIDGQIKCVGDSCEVEIVVDLRGSDVVVIDIFEICSDSECVEVYV